jgi:hypothetical protein
MDQWGKPRRYVKGHQNRGSNNGYWKGDNIGYSGLHVWIRRNLSKPIHLPPIHYSYGK